MGNCGSTYDRKHCLELSTEPLDADPDIVGPGVLAAFALTALITFGAIVVGYFTDSLPEEHLNSLDFAVIDWFSTSSLGRAFGYIRTHFVPFLKKCLFFKPPKNAKKALTKQRREVAFEKFILALSDQQLVTGIAILVAIFANHCRISIYELNIAVSLAWFSSTTHLGTLDVLHRYFRQNVVVRNWRMVGMISILFLLIPGLVLVEAYVFTTPQVPMQCSHFLPSNDDAGIGPLAAVFVIAYLCVGYGSRLYKTFTSEDGEMVDPEWVIWNIILLPSRKMSKPERHDIIEKAINVCNTRRTIYVEGRLEILSGKYRVMRRLRLCIGAYARSFLQCIAALFFFLSYGISGVVADRWMDFHIDLEEGSNTMEFGQIVPLVLLVLPLLAFAEIFYEKTEDTTTSDKPEPHTTHDKQTPGTEKTHESPHLAPSSTSSSMLPSKPHAVDSILPSENSNPDPAYAGFAKTDIKSRLPRAFLDRSRHILLFICFFQIVLGILTGVMLNINGVGSSGGAILLLIPWGYSIAAALRRFVRVGKVLRTLRRKGEEELGVVTVSDSWERTTTRQGKTCYVHHGEKKAVWNAPEVDCRRDSIKRERGST